MGFQEKERTLMTDNMLVETSKILDDINRAIKLVVGKKVSWSKACKENNLDPIKTRRKLLSLAGCRGDIDEVSLEELKGLLYDPYDNLYRFVFGTSEDCIIEMPDDYEKAVDYVLNNCNITDKEKDLIETTFGLKTGVPISIVNYSKAAGFNKSYGYKLFNRALSKMKWKPNADILIHGVPENVSLPKHPTDKAVVYTDVTEDLVNYLWEKKLENARISKRVFHALFRCIATRVEFLHAINLVHVLLVTDSLMKKTRNIGEVTLKAIKEFQADILSECSIISIDEFREGYYTLYPDEKGMWED